MLDIADCGMINLLQKDGRMPIVNPEKLNISETTVRSRLKGLITIGEFKRVLSAIRRLRKR
jgi:DNA-binding Lrp family transcriptional regulator